MRVYVPGVKVETSATIEDPEALGIAVAGLNSDDQARFLIGLARTFDTFSAPMQIRYVTEAIKTYPDGIRLSVAGFVRTLADHVDEVTR